MTAALSFGEWLKRRRQSLGLTQKELARQVGYAQVTLRKVEADELRPSGQMARKLAEALELAPEEQPQFVRFARDEAHWDDLRLPEPFTCCAPACSARLPEPRATCHCPPSSRMTAPHRRTAKPQPACPDHSAHRQRRRTCRAGAAAGRPCDAAGHDPQRRRHGQDQPGHCRGRAANRAVSRMASAGCRWRR